MDCVKNGSLKEETSSEARNPYDFKIDILCMVVGHRNDEGGKSSITIIMKEFLFKAFKKNKI